LSWKRTWDGFLGQFRVSKTQPGKTLKLSVAGKTEGHFCNYLITPSLSTRCLAWFLFPRFRRTIRKKQALRASKSIYKKKEWFKDRRYYLTGFAFVFICSGRNFDREPKVF
jgi:hypothetical protein